MFDTCLPPQCRTAGCLALLAPETAQSSVGSVHSRASRRLLTVGGHLPLTLSSELGLAVFLKTLSCGASSRVQPHLWVLTPHEALLVTHMTAGTQPVTSKRPSVESHWLIGNCHQEIRGGPVLPVSCHLKLFGGEYMKPFLLRNMFPFLFLVCSWRRVWLSGELLQQQEAGLSHLTSQLLRIKLPLALERGALLPSLMPGETVPSCLVPSSGTSIQRTPSFTFRRHF